MIYTTGDDNKMIQWSIPKHSVIWSTPLLTESELKSYEDKKVKVVAGEKKSTTASTFSSTIP